MADQAVMDSSFRAQNLSLFMSEQHGSMYPPNFILCWGSPECTCTTLKYHGGNVKPFWLWYMGYASWSSHGILFIHILTPDLVPKSSSIEFHIPVKWIQHVITSTVSYVVIGHFSWLSSAKLIEIQYIITSVSILWSCGLVS